MASQLRAAGANLRNRRSVAEIMSCAAPQKSAKQYEKGWEDFVEFRVEEKKDSIPTEEEFIQYFDFLLNIKKWKTSSCWTR